MSGEIDIANLPVFPPADVFPMMADDELRGLAEDIKENGLRDPLVVAEVDKETVLVDGRNRRAACEIAKVDPTTRRLNGEDLTAFVLSANIHRRHMTKGQRAMVVAKIYPKPKRGRGEKDPARKQEDSSAFLRQVRLARIILRYSIDDDLANDVLACARALDDAHNEALKRKSAASSEEDQLTKLRARYPELADKVIEDELTLEGAQAEANARDRAAFEQRETSLKLLRDAIYAVKAFGVEGAAEEMRDILRSPDETVQKQVKKFFELGEVTVVNDITDLFEKGMVGILALKKFLIKTRQ